MALDERDIALAVQKFMAIHPLVVKKKKKMLEEMEEKLDHLSNYGFILWELWMLVQNFKPNHPMGWFANRQLKPAVGARWEKSAEESSKVSGFSLWEQRVYVQNIRKIFIWWDIKSHIYPNLVCWVSGASEVIWSLFCELHSISFPLS